MTSLAHAERMMRQMLASGMPVAAHERFAALCRPVGKRTPFPKPGFPVWYRHVAHGELTEATVQEVDISNRDDQYVWRFAVDPATHLPIQINGMRVREMVDDPWPDVYLLTKWGRIVTREARIDGSPGWLPIERREE